MIFNFFRHKKEEESKTFEGRIITDDEISEMIKPKKESFIKRELKEMNDMVENMKHFGE